VEEIDLSLMSMEVETDEVGVVLVPEYPVPPEDSVPNGNCLLE